MVPEGLCFAAVYRTGARLLFSDVFRATCRRAKYVRRSGQGAYQGYEDTCTRDALKKFSIRTCSKNNVFSSPGGYLQSPSMMQKARNGARVKFGLPEPADRPEEFE